MFYKHHKFNGPAKSILGILDALERGDIPQGEAIQIIRSCLQMQTSNTRALIRYSQINEPDYKITMTIQQHRQIYEQDETRREENQSDKTQPDEPL